MTRMQGAGERQLRNALAENTLYASRLGPATAKELDKEALKQKGKEEKLKKKKEKERKKKLEKEKKRLEKTTKKRKNSEPSNKQGSGLGISLGLPPGVGGAPVTSAGSQLQMLVFSPADIASEMALVNSELFSSIPLSEFLHQRWQKKGMEENGAHILAAINQFNDVRLPLSGAKDGVLTYV